MPLWVMKAWDAELGYTSADLEARPAGGPVIRRPEVMGGSPLWGVWTVDPSGNDGVHIFPHSTFEWRAAAHGIDPDDIDSLLQVVLHESFIPRADDPLTPLDPLAAQFLADTHGWPTAWTPGVPDEDRRQACLERIRLVRERIGAVEPAAQDDRQGALLYVGSQRTAPPDPLDPIRQQARLDPIRVAGKKAYLDYRRSALDGPAVPSFELKPPNTFMGMKSGPQFR